MKKPQPLSGRRIAILVADGFEMLEVVVPMKALKAAGAAVEVISLRRGRIRGMQLHQPARRIRGTKTVTQADVQSYDGVLIPGGFISPDLLRQSSAARAFVQAFATAHKPIAMLCHGPWLLASAGVLHGRTITAWPGIRDDVVNAGAVWLDSAVVRDGNLVSSRGPHDLTAFISAMVTLFTESAPITRSMAPAITSAPPRDQPPHTVLRALRWRSLPSLRTILTIALVLGLAAARWQAARSWEHDTPWQ